MQYVVGFMIQPSTERVLLIRKNRPAFQAGKWNGIGGKIEPNESPVEAMVREFREETSVNTDVRDWEHTITLEGDNDQADPGKAFKVHYFRTFVGAFPDFTSVTDEMVMDWEMCRVHHFPCLPNLKWILPLQTSLNIRFPLYVHWRRLD